MESILDKTFDEPNITLELIEQVIDNPLLTKTYDNLTKYTLAKCLLREFTSNSELLNYINSLKKTETYKYFKNESESR